VGVLINALLHDFGNHQHFILEFISLRSQGVGIEHFVLDYRKAGYDLILICEQLIYS
jgi:hypothetical protein